MTSTPTQPRAALHVRVSRTGYGQDVGNQFDELRKVAAQRGWDVVGTYEDASVSRVKTARPRLQRMVAIARASKFDIAAAWKLDRLGRSFQLVLATMYQFNCQGVTFVSLRAQRFDSNAPAMRVFTAKITAFAAFERDLIQVRVVAGIRRAKAAGNHSGRPRKEIDLRLAVALLSAARGLKGVARTLKVRWATPRRRLEEEGQWLVAREAMQREAA